MLTIPVKELVMRKSVFAVCGVLACYFEVSVSAELCIDLTNKNADQLISCVQQLSEQINKLNTKSAERTLDCLTTQAAIGQVAQCPSGYIVTGCTSGGNRSSFTIKSTECVTHTPTDWTAARCCRIKP